MRFEVMKVIAMKIRVFWTDAASTGKSLLTRRRILLPSYSGCSLGLPSRQKGNNFLWDVVNCLYQCARRFIPEYMNHRMLTWVPMLVWYTRNCETWKWAVGIFVHGSEWHSALNVLSAALPECWHLRKVAYWPDGCFYFVHLFLTASMQLA